MPPGSPSRPHTAARQRTRLCRLSASGHGYVNLTQDDADALLALHLAEPPAMLETPAADGTALPPNHPIRQLVREAAWLLSHAVFAA